MGRPLMLVKGYSALSGYDSLAHHVFAGVGANLTS